MSSKHRLTRSFRTLSALLYAVSENESKPLRIKKGATKARLNPGEGDGIFLSLYIMFSHVFVYTSIT